jgi:DNA invertase Pin-like site-specific DNA recombinase
MSKYILYARKSTDVEDKQVLSIEAQITELKEFAKKLDLQIVDILIEKRTAKKPGRPIFGKMLERIAKGEANGIIAWLPDRLSRNSIDSGQIIYMLDTCEITDLKFPHWWFENNPQGKYMLANEFNASKQYVDNLSVNTKRGIRAKIRSGHCPRIAPLGYFNDIRSKTIKINDKTAPLVREVFELYSRGDKRLDDIAEFLFQKGIKTRPLRNRKTGVKSVGGRPLKADRVKNMLTDIFYYGDFKYGGEIYHGKHTPLIDKKLFDEVQKVIVGRGRIQKHKTDPPPLCRLVRCGFCGCYITGAEKIKHQKNGDVHNWTYYRCSHRKRTIPCHEKEVREYNLASQLVTVLDDYKMPNNWGNFMLERIKSDELVTKNNSDTIVSRLNADLAVLNGKIKRLSDIYLDGDIEQADYRERRADFLSDKKSLEGKIERVLTHSDFWIEPMRNWVKNAVSLCEIGENSSHQAMRTVSAKLTD